MQPIDKMEPFSEPSSTWLRLNRLCDGGDCATALEKGDF
jgi:hypothetical protein